MEEVKEKAIRIATHYLAKFTIDEGMRIIVASFTEWVKYVCSLPRGSHLSYEDRYSGSRLSNRLEIPIVDIDNLGKVEILPLLATEWCYRMFRYQDSIRHEPRQRVDLPSTISGDGMAQSVFSAASSFVPDKALDFWAVVTVEWARRCSIEGFIPESLGYQIPAGSDRDEWVTQFLTWSISEGFHIFL